MEYKAIVFGWGNVCCRLWSFKTPSFSCIRVGKKRTLSKEGSWSLQVPWTQSSELESKHKGKSKYHVWLGLGRRTLRNVWKGENRHCHRNAAPINKIQNVFYYRMGIFLGSLYLPGPAEGAKSPHCLEEAELFHSPCLFCFSGNL